MRRRWTMALAVMLLGLVAGRAGAESCSPAMCAGMSPVCWLAYEKFMVDKGRIGSASRCQEVAREVAAGGGKLVVEGLTADQALCACQAAFWSLDSDMQGLPDILDTTEEDSNRAVE